MSNLKSLKVTLADVIDQFQGNLQTTFTVTLAEPHLHCMTPNIRYYISTRHIRRHPIAIERSSRFEQPNNRLLEYFSYSETCSTVSKKWNNWVVCYYSLSSPLSPLTSLTPRRKSFGPKNTLSQQDNKVSMLDTRKALQHQRTKLYN